ncbi:primase C-terminal domain-containing protein [Bacillus sp. ILBB4]|nr:primase C-terminal domain-containing protein [Bacillus sp. ILBB4]
MEQQTTTTNPMIWVECGADLIGNKKFPFTRKHYMFPEYTWQFREAYKNQGVYQTVMQYINPVWYQNDKGKWLINAGESMKWGDFYLDFDSVIESEEDYQKLKEDVRIALRYITVIMNIDISQVRFFFSGGKGIHLTVPAQTLGLEPHVALNQIYKIIMEDIAQYTKHNTLDPKVYDDKRMFRMINSWNFKGQAFKIPLTYDDFKNLSFAEIHQLAQQPREINVAEPFKSTRAYMVIKQHIEEWTQRVSRRQEFSGKIKKLEKEPPCIQAMWQKVFRETVDERNNSCAGLASFYMQQGIEYEEGLGRLLKWNEENCSPPQKPREIEMTVQSVYNGQHKYGCETFKRVSGVCDKEKCPLFAKGEVKSEPAKQA